jgi:hypothetical protein
MRDKHYKPYCYKLAEETNEQIKKLSKENNVSKNLLFLSFIQLTKKYGLPKMQQTVARKNKNSNN